MQNPRAGICASAGPRFHEPWPYAGGCFGDHRYARCGIRGDRPMRYVFYLLGGIFSMCTASQALACSGRFLMETKEIQQLQHKHGENSRTAEEQSLLDSYNADYKVFIDA